MATVIYQIQDLNKRIYIGSAIDFERRRKSHLQELKANRHSNKRLQNYYNKYGIESFAFSILEDCHIKNLMEREQHYIDTLNPFFNICRVAGKTTGRPGGMAGKKLSEERKAHISSYTKGKVLSEETKDKIRQKAIGRKGYWAGKKLSEETRKKISEARKNIKLSEEHLAKLTFKGCKHTEEHKASLSKKMMGGKLSEETKKRISKSKKGVPRKNKIKIV